MSKKNLKPGFAEGYNELAATYAAQDNEDSHEEALRWWHKSAESGNTSGQFKLGLAYYEGKGTPQDYEEAVHWWRQAANNGHIPAQNMLGQMYYRGYGIELHQEADFEE